ncbi:MAG: hypothetical protein A2252_08620 [Elusimicrobia bacterium RIFOXYA2_FULL_39_19]|nr:MAG: hypothetical protein A2252_08620 [Elusimicrobia bacterium RIFOXYA2_FULL_39_19]
MLKDKISALPKLELCSGRPWSASNKQSKLCNYKSDITDKIHKLITASFIICLFSSGLFAKEHPVRIKAEVSAHEITIGDDLVYSLTLEYPAGYMFVPPDFENVLGGFEIRKQAILPVKNKGGFFFAKYRISRYIFNITSFNAGEQKISSFTAVFMNESGDAKELPVPEITIIVNPVKESSQDQGDIRDIKPPLSLGINLLLMLITAFLLAAGIYIYFLMNKKPETVQEQAIEEEKLSPEEIALQKLQELLAKDLIKAGLVKEFYIELSEIVRMYLSEKHSVFVIERTTDEVCRDLKKIVEKKKLAEIKEFLEECDMVKFAKYIPDQIEVNADVEKARQIIQQSD